MNNYLIKNIKRILACFVPVIKPYNQGLKPFEFIGIGSGTGSGFLIKINKGTYWFQIISVPVPDNLGTEKYIN